VTQGKLGVSDARSPPANIADKRGMASRSPLRRPGIDSRITEFVIAWLPIALGAETAGFRLQIRQDFPPDIVGGDWKFQISNLKSQI
jgi:hypothetical protein